MKAENTHPLNYVPWLSVPLVLMTYLILWHRLPPELIVHWTISGTTDRGFLMGRGFTLLTGLISLLVILISYTWKIRNSNAEKQVGTLFRYYCATGVLTIICLGIAVYNVW